jgi:hypothetical protein
MAFGNVCLEYGALVKRLFLLNDFFDDIDVYNCSSADTCVHIVSSHADA